MPVRISHERLTRAVGGAAKPLPDGALHSTRPVVANCSPPVSSGNHLQSALPVFLLLEWSLERILPCSTRPATLMAYSGNPTRPSAWFRHAQRSTPCLASSPRCRGASCGHGSLRSLANCYPVASGSGAGRTVYRSCQAPGIRWKIRNDAKCVNCGLNDFEI